MPDIKFFKDAQGKVYEVPTSKLDRFKQKYPNATEATQEELSLLESKRATDNEKKLHDEGGYRIGMPKVPSVEMPTAQDVQIGTSDHTKLGVTGGLEQKGMQGAIETASQHHRLDPEIQFRAKYGAYKDNPELFRDEDAPEMVERKRKKSWLEYIGTGGSAMGGNAAPVDRYGTSGHDDPTHTRLSQEYLERIDKQGKQQEIDKLSDFLTNTESGRDFVEYDDELTEQYKEVERTIGGEINKLQKEIEASKEQYKISGRNYQNARIILDEEKKRKLENPDYQPDWRRQQIVEEAQKTFDKESKRILEIDNNVDIDKANEVLNELIKGYNALKDRDSNAVTQWWRETQRRLPGAIQEAVTLGIDGVIKEATYTPGGRLTKKAEDLTGVFHEMSENLYKNQTSIAQDIANSTLHSIAFMVGMGATSGLSSLIARGAIKGLGGKILTTGAQAFIRQGTQKGAGKVIKIAGKNISEAFVQTVLMPSTLAGALERNREEPGSFLNAYAMNFIAAFGEVGLERAGDFMPGFKFRSDFMKGVTKYTHLNSLFPQLIEEDLQTVWHALFKTGEGEWGDLIDPRNRLVTFGTIASTQGGAIIAETGGYAAGKYRNIKAQRQVKIGLDKNIANMQNVFGDKATQIMEELNDNVEKNLTKRGGDTYKLPQLDKIETPTNNMTEDQKDAMATYTMAYGAKRGLERAKAESKVSARNKIKNLVNSNVNKHTGTIIMADVPGMDSPVPIHGNIQFKPDGTIDHNKSGELYYKDADGKQKVTSSKYITLAETVDPAQIENDLAAQKEFEVEKDFANRQVRRYRNGEQVKFTDQTGAIPMYGQVTGVDDKGNYIVSTQAGEVVIEPRQIVPEKHLEGVENNSEVKYINDKGRTVTGTVTDAFSMRNNGMMVIDGQEVSTDNIIGVVETKQYQPGQTISFTVPNAEGGTDTKTGTIVSINKDGRYEVKAEGQEQQMVVDPKFVDGEAGVAPKTEVETEQTDIEAKAQEIEDRRKEELEGFGRKQIEKGINRLKKATSVEDIANEIIKLRNNANNGAAITAEEVAFIEQKVQELESQGYEIMDLTNLIYNDGYGNNMIANFISINDHTILTQDQIKAVEKELEDREKRLSFARERGASEQDIEIIKKENNRPIYLMTTTTPQINKNGERIQGHRADVLSIGMDELNELLPKSKKDPSPLNIRKINAKYDAEIAALKGESVKTPEQLEAEKQQLAEQTRQQQAELEKKEFYDTLPRKQSGKDKGELNHNQFTPEQKLKFVEFEYGKERAIAGAEVEVKNAEKRLTTAQTQLNNDPLNAAKIEAEIKAKEELDFYKSYVYEARRQQTEENKKASTSSIAEEQAKQEKERAEAEAQRQAEQADIEALKGIPDVTVDKAKDARARGYRSVNGVRVDRRKAIPIQHFKDVVRKFSTNEKDHVKAQRTIVEADDLVPSHKGGQKNPEFFNDEGQPKQRTDEASKAARESIATNPNPKEITGGVSAYTGAPLFTDNGEIIQGHGRTDGLQEMWENHPDAAAIYKQHLIETASEYGMTPEQVMAMKKPIAGDRVSVTDAEAIRLGQLSAQDTESGGIQRIPAKQTSVALGENMGRFAQILFESTNEDAISTVIEKNGRKAIDYLRQKGVVNPTQYQSAFDKDRNITPEAKKDLQDIASQMLFEGANDNIEHMFDALPDKAQKAILQTIHRDAKNPKSERIVKELQQAIEAYYHLQGHDGFANATDYKSTTIAARAAKNSTVMFNSESDLPLQKYSNFAMEMAVLFKTDTQKGLRQRFNSLYDNIQGVGGDVFNAAEKLSLVEAIKKHFNNIDYVSDGQTKRTDVAGDSRTSQKGQQTEPGRTTTGESVEGEKRSTDSTGRVESDNDVKEKQKIVERISKQLNTDVIVYNTPDDIPSNKKDAYLEKKKASKGWYIGNKVYVVLSNHINALDVQETLLHEIVGHKGIKDMLGREKHEQLLTKIFDVLPKEVQAELNEKYKGDKYIAADEYIAKLAENYDNLSPQDKTIWEKVKQAIINFIQNDLGIKLTEQNVDDVIRGLLAESKSRLEGKQSAPIDIVEHARQTVEKAKPKEVSISLPADATHNDIRDAYDAQKEKVAYFDVGDRVIRAERKYTYHKGGKVIKTQYLHIEWLSSKKENADVYKHWRENIDGTWTETIHVAHNNWIREQKKKDKPAEPIDIVKVAKETVEKHTKAEQRISEAQAELDKAKADVDTNPTEAQKEAGNYKKGHVRVAGFDITIENPKNTDRKGVDAQGNEWSTTMNNHYGYFKRTKGKDGDHIDVFVGDNLQSEKVFVVDQVNEDGAFDEHKVMLGFDSAEQAKEAYLSNYEDGWNGLKDITETTVEDFKKWIDVDTKKSKAFADYKENQTAQQYGSQNKIISQEKYNELREKLKKKLNNLNIGFDPEVFSLGAQMAAYHIEAGAVKFKDFAQRMIADVGEAVRPYLKSFYEGARLTPGFENLSKQMDAHKDVVNADVENIEKEEVKTKEKQTKQQPKTLSIWGDSNSKRAFVNDIKNRLGSEKLNIVSIRKIASEHGIIDAKDTTLQEYVEIAVIEKAKDIRNKEITPEEKYKEIVELYNSQPSINMRSSERIEKQQYSTPIPISFLAGEFINEVNPQSVLEPSAGNGMMVFNVEPSTVIANEIDNVRLENLKEQPFKTVMSQDGSKEFNIEKVDAVVMNPPFGRSEAIDYEGYKISGLDEQMVVNALASMKDGGRASIIIGGHTRYKNNGSLAAQKAFINYLYDKYNVADIINIDGGLYSKQGTTYPIRMILINGRRADLERRYAPLQKDARAEVVKTFEELYSRIKESQNEENLLHNRLPRHSDHGARETEQGNRGNVSRRTSTSDRSNDRGRGGESSTRSIRPTKDGRSSNITQESSGFDDAGRADTQTVQSGGEQTHGNRTEIYTRGVSKENTLQFLDRSDGRPKPLKVDITKEKAQYPTRSKSGAIGSVVPSNVAQTLNEILHKFKDIDGYVQAKLGYETKEELYGALAAEQVDGVAMAIYQIEEGKSLIIGDMTGVGKGRQAAAVIRYAHLQGKKPIFITEKAHLFSDMHRDLSDIGSAHLKPFIFNAKSSTSNPTITNQDGIVVYDTPSNKVKNEIFKTGTLPAEYDYAVLTYSQLNGNVEKNGETPKQSFFRDIAADNVLVMDESHNAGGGGNTGKFILDVLPSTKGVTYLSGTFAKRADNMPIYALKTSMNEANMSQDELIDAIQNGGVVLQEIMSKNLTEAGQMIRRERDFTGVSIDWETIDNQKEKHFTSFDKVINIFNQIIKFQSDYVDPIVEAMNDQVKERHGEIAKRKGVRNLGVSNTPFASKTFNAVRQLLFSLKAENIAQEAIKEIEAGRKPVIAVDNTMESFLQELGVEGDVIENYDFSVTLLKGLEGIFRITEVDANGERTHSQIDISRLDNEIQQKYNELKELIHSASSGVSISPIDVIKTQIESSGYSIGELTGRKNVLQFNDDGTATIVRRQDTDKKELTRDFNNGDLDALIINKSASTGISLHASTKFADQKQRVMLFAQNQLDVNTEVQMRGRIDRTGQAQRGAYRYIISPIPAEQRMIMMFKSKLKSLDANTTSNQKSKLNEIEVVDFLNKYGDEIIVEYLKENPDINEKMLDPFKMKDMKPQELESFNFEDNGASKASGRAALLTVKEQEAFYSEMAEKYTNVINYLNDSGANDLEMTTMPLNAETKSKHIVVEGKNLGNAFSEDSYLETVEVDVLKKPMTSKEALQQVEKNTNGLNAVEYRDSIIEKLNAFVKEQVDAETQKVIEEQSKKDKAFFDKVEKEAGKLLTDGAITNKEAYIEEKRKEREAELEERIERRTDAIKARGRTVRSTFQSLPAGRIVMVPTTLNIDQNTTYVEGMFLGFKMKEKLNPSSITAEFATLDGRRNINVPLSKVQFLNAVRSETMSNMRFMKATVENWDSMIPKRTRKTAHIVTGNLLQAYGNEKLKGQLISYTTKDGQIKEGILLPETYKAGEQTMRQQVINNLDNLRDGKPLIDKKNNVSIVKQGSNYAINVPLSKARGGKYFLDAGLREFVYNKDFSQVGDVMRGIVSEENIKDALQYLSDKFNISVDVRMKNVDSTGNINKDTNENIRFRESDNHQFKAPIEKVLNTIENHISVKQNEFANIDHDMSAEVKEKVLFEDIKDFGKYGRYEIVPVSNPILNIHNLNRAIYSLGSMLKPIQDLHSRGYLDTMLDYGYLNPGLVESFSLMFNERIKPYEEALLKAKHLSTEAAQAEIMDIIKDIDYARDYYERLAKDQSILRTEEAPRFREADQTDTPEFKKWFKDSKVVDKQGNPLVVYHGTRGDFNTFEPGHATRPFAPVRKEFYFTDNSSHAEDFIPYGIGRNIMPIFLSISNPKIKDYNGKHWAEGDVDLDKDVEKAKEEGFNGYIAKNIKDGYTISNQYIAFEPTQIKSAIGNVGTFDAANDDIRFRSKEELAEQSEKAKATNLLRQEVDKVSWKFKTRLKEAWVDNFAQVKVLQDALKKNGLDIAEHNDYYLQATHIPGKVDARIEDYTNRYQKPLSKAIHDVQNKGVSHRNIENYVMLSEGLVRNERMRNEALDRWLEENPGADRAAQFEFIENLPEDYSGVLVIEEEVGMSAQEFIDEIEQEAGKDVISNLWAKINAATHYTLQKQYEAGFITKAEMEHYMENKKYVPLRGHDDVTAEDVYNYPSSMGVYFENPIKRADGRVSRAESPFAYIGQMAHSAIIHGVKNQHNQMLLRLSRLDKSGLITNSRSWEVNVGTKEKPVWMVETAPFDSDIDTYIQNQVDFEERMRELQEQGMARQSGSKRVDVGGMFIKPRQAEQHEITVFENGVRHTVYINANPAIARAINETNKWHVGETWGIIEQVLKVNRQMAANFTTRDVRFIFTNFARDVNMASTLIWAEEGGKQMIDFNKNLNPAFGTVKRHFTGKADLNKKNDAYFREFLMNGGMTGYYQLYELDRQAKKLEREAKKGDKRNALDRGKSVFNAIDIMNEVVENTTRFAAYMTARESGKSVVQSVHAAKNVSVNFNQKGAGTSVSKNAFEKALFSAAGAVIPSYLFSNANIQGMYRIYQATKGSPLRMGAAFGAYTLAGLMAPRGTSYLSKGYIKAMQAAAGVAALSWIAPVLASLVGGDDGEEEYMKQGEYDRQNNFTLMLPSGSFLKYPISHEFRLWYKLGDHAYQLLTGHEDAERAATEMMYAVSDLLPANPLGAFDASPAELAPDFARPFAQLGTNTDFKGSSIYNEWANPDVPGYLNTKTNKKGEPLAPELLVRFLKGIDHMTGGDGVAKGKVSPNPDKVHHLFRGFAGGLYTNIMQGISFGFEVYNAVNGEGFNLKAKDTPARAFYTSKDDLRFDSGTVNREYYEISRNASKTIGRANRYKKQYLEADINLQEYIEKIGKLDLTTANKQHEFIKEIKKMERQLPELQGKEQKDKELEIYQKKKELVELTK